MLERLVRDGPKSGSLRMFFHLPMPYLSIPALNASSSSLVHFIFWCPMANTTVSTTTTTTTQISISLFSTHIYTSSFHGIIQFLCEVKFRKIKCKHRDRDSDSRMFFTRWLKLEYGWKITSIMAVLVREIPVGIYMSTQLGGIWTGEFLPVFSFHFIFFSNYFFFVLCYKFVLNRSYVRF